MRIALASSPFPKSIDDGLFWIAKFVKQAAAAGAEIICFPESYLPGLRGVGFEVAQHNPGLLTAARQKACDLARENAIALILPMDWDHPDGILNIAFVIDHTGQIIGWQTKNQLDPTEDVLFIPGTQRQLFELKGLKFGITICHEGFRYPESVRWAAARGAHVVFHPHCTGGDTAGIKITEWGDKNSPYYEKAMMMRAMENTIYFASVNYGFAYPDSASSIIAPDGTCIIHQAYGSTGVIMADIDLDKATGLLARRFKPELLG